MSVIASKDARQNLSNKLTTEENEKMIVGWLKDNDNNDGYDGE